MIVRRYGGTVVEVLPEFAPEAFNEIDFARRGGFTMDWQEFQARYERTGERALVAEAEGHVKIAVEASVLDLLGHRVAEAEHGLAPGELLLLESQAGRDYPRLHERTETLVEHGHNRLHFYYYVKPPLRFGVYAPRAR